MRHVFKNFAAFVPTLFFSIGKKAATPRFCQDSKKGVLVGYIECFLFDTFAQWKTVVKSFLWFQNCRITQNILFSRHKVCLTKMNPSLLFWAVFLIYNTLYSLLYLPLDFGKYEAHQHVKCSSWYLLSYFSYTIQPSAKIQADMLQRILEFLYAVHFLPLSAGCLLGCHCPDPIKVKDVIKTSQIEKFAPNCISDLQFRAWLYDLWVSH